MQTLYYELTEFWCVCFRVWPSFHQFSTFIMIKLEERCIWIFQNGKFCCTQMANYTWLHDSNESQFVQHTHTDMPLNITIEIAVLIKGVDTRWSMIESAYSILISAIHLFCMNWKFTERKRNQACACLNRAAN